MPASPARILIAMQLLLALIVQPARAASYDNPLAQDLGFTNNLAMMRTGTLFRRVFDVQDSDASFIINGTPLYYRLPRNKGMLAPCEEQFEIALANARAEVDHNWRALALLLEATACFYRKINRSGDALLMLNELVDLLSARAPASADLSEAERALGQTACAEHLYSVAEQSFQNALQINIHLYGSRHSRVAEMHTRLYFLYLDMGRTDLAVRSKREMLASSRIDMVAVEREKAYHQTKMTWPAILRSADGVATVQQLDISESQADEDALEALAKYRQGLDPFADIKKAEQKRKEEHPDEPPPPNPYRINAGINYR